MSCLKVLEPCKTAKRETPLSNGIKKSRVERKTQRRKHWSELLARVIAKGKGGSVLMKGGNESRRFGERVSVCEVSELTRMKRTDQASERGTNQHLLIASGVPGERSICGEGEERRVGGRKDNCSRHSSKNTKECHIFLRLSTDYSGE